MNQPDRPSPLISAASIVGHDRPFSYDAAMDILDRTISSPDIFDYYASLKQSMDEKDFKRLNFLLVESALEMNKSYAMVMDSGAVITPQVQHFGEPVNLAKRFTEGKNIVEILRELKPLFDSRILPEGSEKRLLSYTLEIESLLAKATGKDKASNMVNVVMLEMEQAIKQRNSEVGVSQTIQPTSIHSKNLFAETDPDLPPH